MISIRLDPTKKINIEVDRHLIELIFNSDDSIRGHEAKLERKNNKGKNFLVLPHQ
uniref:Uncharacterized protein n=1 Tax=Klebsiella pneumoniae TaxID=573 RepID=A0A8B0SRQ7_KLEPN|nr:hypothetical protein [Klebsiella pneumoniae]